MKFLPPTRIRSVIYFLAGTLFFASCQKELKLQKNQQDAIFASTPKEKETVEVLKEVSTILKEVYQSPNAYYEVNAAIYSDYHADERVLLKDLLFPEKSPLYKSEKFKASKAIPGEFKKTFYEVLAKSNYPYLKKAMRISTTQNNLRSIAPVPTDTAMEIFSNSNGVSIYFPYSENFGSLFTPAYFDNINTDPWGNLATVIPADREADSAPGSIPSRRKRTVNNVIEWYIHYTSVTVNDIYAETHPTHIVGVGAESIMVVQDDPPTAPGINRVFHGWSILNDQLDRFISFSGNGGGSEMKIARISGYLQIQNQQVSDFTGDVMTVHYKRKDINKEKWKRVYGVWDADWKTDNLEQTYAVWEDDTQGTKTYTGSLSTTVTISPGNTATGAIGYSIQVQTQDELVTQRKLTRTAYFGGAKADQGWGFQMCDKDGTCRYDDTFLPTGQYWPKYDEGTIWSYTWPYNIY